MKGNQTTATEIGKQIKKLLKRRPDERADAARLDELRRLLGRQDMNSSTENEVLRQWQSFLRSSHSEMVRQLCQRIERGQRSAIRTLWGVIASSPTTSASGMEIVDNLLLQRWVRATLQIDFDQSIHQMLGEFWGPFRDVQYHVLLAIGTVAKEMSEEKNPQVDRLMELLMKVPIATSQEDLEENGGLLFPLPKDATSQEPDDSSYHDDDVEDSEASSEESSVDEKISNEEPPRKRQKRSKGFAYSRFQCHVRAWSQAWLAALRLPLQTSSLKLALQFLPDKVLRRVARPLLFADFMMEAFSQGGMVAVLALDGLFLLMTEHSLEYPNFYRQLYSLVTPRLFAVKYRTRFLTLLTKSLTRNPLLPAHIVAAFIKRLARCTLAMGPSGTLFCLALISNLLDKFPETACLVHRPGTKMEDGFDPHTDNPEECQALDSSLWELHALAHHYHPAVVTLSKSIGTNSKLHDLDDFLSHTYKSLFDQERKQRQRNVPLTFIKPNRLLAKDDIFDGFLETS